jgi:hypothetical protein
MRVSGSAGLVLTLQGFQNEPASCNWLEVLVDMIVDSPWIGGMNVLRSFQT